MPGYGTVAPYGQLNYKQDTVDGSVQSINRINKFTGKCIRYAVRPEQGQGFSFYENGDSWLWPEPLCPPRTILTRTGLDRHIVLDEITGKWYEVGTRNGPQGSGINAIYVDKDSSYGGAEIPCTIRARESRANLEHKKIEHLESHVRFRPNDEDNRNTTGHDANGYRSAFEVNFRLYKDGEQDFFAVSKGVDLNSDIVVDRRREGNRIQPEIATSTSEFKLVGWDSYYNILDKSTVNETSNEQDWQDELSVPVLWVTRGPTPELNRASGVSLDGSYFSTISGPDGQDDSAISFSAADGLTGSLSGLDGNMTVMFGIASGEPDVLSIGPLTVSVVESMGVYSLRWNDGVNDVSVPLNWTGGGAWTLIKVSRNGDNLVVSENGYLRDTYSLISVVDVSGALALMDGQDGDVYDIRVYGDVVSDSAFRYYYDDIVENEGNALLPIWL